MEDRKQEIELLHIRMLPNNAIKVQECDAKKVQCLFCGWQPKQKSRHHYAAGYHLTNCTKFFQYHHCLKHSYQFAMDYLYNKRARCR